MKCPNNEHHTIDLIPGGGEDPDFYGCEVCGETWDADDPRILQARINSLEEIIQEAYNDAASMFAGTDEGEQEHSIFTILRKSGVCDDL